jgi:hypothetical protein
VVSLRCSWPRSTFGADPNRHHETHRAELSVAERAELVAEWVRLTVEKVAQVAPPGGRQPRDQGIRSAVCDLGIDRTEAQRSIKIAGIAPEAKHTVRVGAGARDDRRPPVVLEASGAPGPQRMAPVGLPGGFGAGETVPAWRDRANMG